MRSIAATGLLALGSWLVVTPARASDIPSPETHLGYQAGADFHLAGWGTVVDYFRKVDDASDRVQLRELGRTTEDRPYVVAIVSSPKTLADLDTYKTYQRRLADPRVQDGEAEAADPVARGKTVVLITCSIHSSETASTFMAMELLHDLATRDDPETLDVLENTILLLVPSANPDGVDKVASWYERSKGTPWEGGGMPELYHKYAGHDTNRDWFMLNLKETQLLTRLLYHEWFPTIVYDVHQMGGRGARLFVPPFFDPINPNLDPRIHQGIAMIGAHMALDLASSGKRGVLTHALYDNWWNGGNRTTPQRHNIVAVLTEAASVKMATPVLLQADDLKGGGRGFPDHKPAANFVDPWPGGWWRLRDVVEYERTCAHSLLTLAARYRTQFQANYRNMGLDAIARGLHEPPSAWVVPADANDPGSAVELVRLLRETGIEARRAGSAFTAGGVTYPAGSFILPAAQPYRAHLKDMMERQVYPARFAADGKADPPYDVAGWTLPLLMGVRSLAIAEPFDAPGETLDRITPDPGRIEGPQGPEYYAFRNRAVDDFSVLNALHAAGVQVDRLARPMKIGGADLPAGALLFKGDPKAKSALDKVLPTASTRILGLKMPSDWIWGKEDLLPCRPQRIGVYQPWMPSMDEGWTRLVLERFGFPYTTLHNADLRVGDLKSRFDALLIPSIESKVLRDGFARDETAPEYVGGLGREGAEALRAFVREGGTLVCLEDSCPFAIEELELPMTDALKGLPTSVVFGPGSIVRVAYPRADPAVSLGMDREGTAYFDRSLAFDVEDGKPAQVIARYAGAGLLESGWLLGAEKIEGKAAVVQVPVGEGRVILFGFPPQNRGQTRATFRLLFNALLRGGTDLSH